MSPKINIVNPHGFCAGVGRAIKLSEDTSKKYNSQIYILGEIVHNSHVVANLESRGIKTVNSIDEIPESSVMIIRAHGAPPEIYQQALSKNLTIIDATCPMVAQVHKEVKQLAAENKKIIYIASDLTHEEALGVYGEAPENIILTTLKDVLNLEVEDPKNSIVITQTTLSKIETQKTLESIKQKYPEITVKPHVCNATGERQDAVIEAAKKSDLIIIVGSPTSSNSKRLMEAAKSTGTDSYIVDNASELNSSWFENKQFISISSGASTPEEILDEVVQTIKNLVQ
jgi:4-hydroxy-3-methylbut-2-enyl diphosphate reductase